ncbi:hypothetical protein E5170_00440 [Pseudomonas atacamensis]|uniref:Uncharacterized protein n=1 Tax=Pseudomonas atacamensis TaxID=2565368 RepID=A0AAQ2I2Q5_9PSED|nr:hypothetical protein DMX04_23620 [Pseudomonas koreensis]THF35945.1 hypothetical protein E5170_00440 [Pseudomonas atacamensis]
MRYEVGGLSGVSGFPLAPCRLPASSFICSMALPVVPGQLPSGRFPRLPKNSQETVSPKSHKEGRTP